MLLFYLVYLNSVVDLYRVIIQINPTFYTKIKCCNIICNRNIFLFETFFNRHYHLMNTF